MKRYAIALLLFVFVVVGPVSAQGPDKVKVPSLEDRITELETQLSNLQEQYNAQQELVQSVAIMLAANYASDCFIQNAVGSLLGIGELSQEECMGFRIELYEGLSPNDQPFSNDTRYGRQEG